MFLTPSTVPLTTSFTSSAGFVSNFLVSVETIFIFDLKVSSSIKIISKDYNLASKNSYDILKYLKQNIKQEIIENGRNIFIILKLICSFFL